MRSSTALKWVVRLAVVAVMGVAPVAIGGTSATGQSAPSAPVQVATMHPGRGALVREGVVSISRPSRARGHAAAVLPVLSHNGKSVQPSASASGSSVPVVSLSVSGVPTTANTDVLTSLDAQVSALGSDQGVEPPDTILGTSGSQVVEMVNDSVTVSNVSGNGVLTPVAGPLDLNSFFAVPSGYSFSDPRVVYDPVGQRWIASGVAFTASGGSAIVVDVSSSSDAAGNWTEYRGDWTSTVIHDQPKLGLSNEQVVLSWNDFLLGALFEGATTWVFDRAGLESGSVLNSSTFGPDSSAFSIVPASVVSGNTEYAVWNDADCSYAGCSTGSPTLGVIEINGTPANNDVTLTTSYPSIAAMSNPPAAIQPSPGNAIDTDDDRLLTAVWSNGMLWTAGNDACTPSGDSAVRSCLRLIGVDVSNPGSPRIAQDFDAGAVGAELYYPALALDGAGDLGVVYSASSSSLAPSVGTASQLAGASPDTLSTGPWVVSGAGAYVDGTSSPRWGDYSGAVAVPGSSSGQLWGAQIWVAGEYAAQSNSNDWGTAAAELTLGSTGAPSVPTSLFATATPSTLAADGTATSTITATATDSSSNPVSDDTLKFTMSPPTSGACGKLSSASGTTGTNGQVSVTYTATTTPGTCTITATDQNNLTGKTTVDQVSYKIAVAANPSTLSANGHATSTITATVTDSSDKPVSGDPVAFSMQNKTSCGTLGPQSASTTDSTGQVSVTYTSAKQAGTCAITASDQDQSGSVTVTQVKGHR